MASVIIKEEDYTTSEVYSPTDTIVYIPGMIGVDGTLDFGVPTLFSSLTDFEAAVGSAPKKLVEETDESTEVSYDKSYVMAKQLIAAGMKVLYEAVNVDNKADMIETLKDGKFWEKLYDRSLYNIRFITSGGYAAIQQYQASAEAIATNMAQCAFYNASSGKGRGDCVALVDHQKDVTLEQIKDIFTGESSFAKGLEDAGSFASAFTPWGKFQIGVKLGEAKGDIIEVIGGNEVEFWALPASFAYLLAYNNMIANNPTWYAAAGLARGSVPYLYKPMIEIGELASTDLQSREENTVAVNPIINIPGYGYRIWGNRTLRQIINGLKATSFLNIRNLCSDIKKTSYQACKLVTFEQNTDVMWANLKANITPLLDKMASGEGISGYKITRVRTNEKAKVVGKIKIVPIEAVEDFELTIQLVDSLETETEE